MVNLKSMGYSDLKKVARRLNEDGASIDYKGMNDEAGIKKLRKKIGSFYKKNACLGKATKNQCVKDTKAYTIGDLRSKAEECGIPIHDSNGKLLTRPQLCQLLTSAGAVLSDLPEKKVKDVDKTLTGSDEYKALNKLKKVDKDGPDLVDKAKKLGIKDPSKLLKHDLIVAIMEAKGSPSSPKKKSKSVKKTSTPPSPKKKSVKKTSTPPSPKKKSKSVKKTSTPPSPKKKKTKSKSKSCGEYEYTDLLDMRLSQLKKILKDRGIEDANPSSVKEGAAMVCAASKGETCGEHNGFECGEDASCNINSNPGLCMPNDMTPTGNAVESFMYKGKKIMGSKFAIQSLKKKLKVGGKKESKTHISKNELINIISSWTGTDPEFYSEWSKDELTERLEALTSGLNDDSTNISKNELINAIASLSGQNPSTYVGWPRRALLERLESFFHEENEQERDEEDRNELINVIVAHTGDNPRKYRSWSKDELKDKIEGVVGEGYRANLINKVSEMSGKSKKELRGWKDDDLEDYISQNMEKKKRKKTVSFEEEDEVKPKKSKKKKPVTPDSDDDSGDDSEDDIPIAKKFTKKSILKDTDEEPVVLKKSKKKKSVTPPDDDTDEEPVVLKKSKKKKSVTPPDDDSDSEDDKPLVRAKQENISYKDVEKVLTDIISNKPGDIDDFVKIQNTVLQCLGLVG